jgi:hypothetical protein
VKIVALIDHYFEDIDVSKFTFWVNLIGGSTVRGQKAAVAQTAAAASR